MVVVSKLQQWLLPHLRLLLPLHLPTVVSRKLLQSAERDEGSPEAAAATGAIAVVITPAEELIIKIKTQTRQMLRQTQIIIELKTKVIITDKGVQNLTRGAPDTAQMSPMTHVPAIGRMVEARLTAVIL